MASKSSLLFSSQRDHLELCVEKPLSKGETDGFLLVLLYAILNVGTALADNFPMLVIFCFLIGCAGSVALNNVAGTISDLFGVRIARLHGPYAKKLTLDVLGRRRCSTAHGLVRAERKLWSQSGFAHR